VFTSGWRFRPPLLLDYPNLSVWHKTEGVVNFERFVMLIGQIRDLQNYQQYSYSFTVEPHLFDYLLEGKNKYGQTVSPIPFLIILLSWMTNSESSLGRTPATVGLRSMRGS